MEFKYEGKSLKSGVYQITNAQNGRVYIGSAKRFKERWKQHSKSLLGGKHYNKFLQRDFDKCGADVFIFEVLEIIVGDKLARTLCEQKWINKIPSVRLYNNHKVVIEAERRCFSNTPEETRRKMSLAKKGKTWEQICGDIEKTADRRQKQSTGSSGKNNYFYGLHLVPWNKDLRGYKTQPCSEETKRKIAESQKGKIIPTEQRLRISQSVSKANKKLWKQEWYRKKTVAGRIGLKHSEETKKKLSLASKGKPKSSAHKQALKEAWKRRK